MDVVVVESPAKARTINKYLGGAYKVVASVGHVRDLPNKEGSVLPDDDFQMIWQVDKLKEKQITEITKALKGAKTIYLATDPDREGEAISWHIEDILRERELVNSVEIRRVVFNQVTKKAVREALENPRRIDDDLVEAYMARRALDYLMGFNLSPVLWRKLPGADSAGRVQSVALRIICDREQERECFTKREYWTVEMNAANTRGDPFTAKLTHLDGKKLDQFDLPDEDAAAHARTAVEASNLAVAKIERKQSKRNPYPPFITSTLQQQASGKLGFSATKTMRVAQRLYEGLELDGETVGLITYMRTDSVVLGSEAIAACRDMIGRTFGPRYLPSKPRIYKTKAKNAQEAHEAIRPTDLSRDPRKVKPYLPKDEFRLYDLVWRQTMASQMASAEIDQVSADLEPTDAHVRLRATGSTIIFDGFLKLNREDRDDPSPDADGERRLPELSEGESVQRISVAAEQHFTQPPARYTEASLIKTMEKLGIGRPSTYAPILQKLQDRDYVRLEKRSFIPEDRGRFVTTFLTNFFSRYVDYDFTAGLEEQLDDISGGRLKRKDMLLRFWDHFSKAISETNELTFQSVREALDEALGAHFFPPSADGSDPRLCPACKTGRLTLDYGKHGGYIRCSGYPECKYTGSMKLNDDEKDVGVALAAGPITIGPDPETGLNVTLRRGPYGLYLQVGESEKKPKKKPKRQGVPKGWGPADIDLDTALRLLALPRKIGDHPDDGKPIEAGIGPYGPYVRHDRVYANLEDPHDALTIGLNHAVILIAEKGKSRGRGTKALRDIGDHPEDGKPVRIFDGRYGPYVKHGRTNATLPRDTELESLTLDDAIALIAAKSKRTKSKGKTKQRRKTAKPAGQKSKTKSVKKPSAQTSASTD